jgi:hypothetical protein
MIIVTTEHGTKYMIDLDKTIAIRIPNGGNVMVDDDRWFEFSHVHAFDRETMEHIYDQPYIIGKSIFFEMIGRPRDYDWKISTDVVFVKEIS